MIVTMGSLLIWAIKITGLHVQWIKFGGMSVFCSLNRASLLHINATAYDLKHHSEQWQPLPTPT